jgi:hypothetical protein
MRESTTGEKMSFIALRAIFCACSKLPLRVPVKGRTVQCERKFGHYPMVILRHSKSGRATENVIVEFSEWLHRETANYRPCVLIIDVYPSHRTERVLATAEAEDVELLFVPAGGTGRFKPIDRRISEGRLRDTTVARMTQKNGSSDNRRHSGEMSGVYFIRPRLESAE